MRSRYFCSTFWFIIIYVIIITSIVTIITIIFFLFTLLPSSPTSIKYVPGATYHSRHFTCITSSNLLRHLAVAAGCKSLQSCPALCDPIDSSPPGSSVPGILQARTTLEWVAISFSSAWKWKVKVKLFSCVRLLATPWTAAYQAPPSMGFSRQEYCSGVPLPSPSNILCSSKFYYFHLRS